MESAGCCDITMARVREAGERPGALWHIFDPQDADKIRELLNKVRRTHICTMLYIFATFEWYRDQSNLIIKQNIANLIFLDGLLINLIMQYFRIDRYVTNGTYDIVN